MDFWCEGIGFVSELVLQPTGNKELLEVGVDVCTN
jgi:hypothetical protein